MNWIEKIRKKLAALKMQRLEKTNRHKRDFVDIERAQRVGLILNAGQCTSDEIRSFRLYLDDLKRQRKHVSVIEINFNPKSEPQFSRTAENIFLSPAQLNWLDFPKSDLESLILDLSLDVLIDLDPTERITSRFVCALSRARTRVGMHRQGMEFCYELMIEAGSPPPIPRMIETYTHFLSMIEK